MSRNMLCQNNQISDKMSILDARIWPLWCPNHVFGPYHIIGAVGSSARPKNQRRQVFEEFQVLQEWQIVKGIILSGTATTPLSAQFVCS